MFLSIEEIKEKISILRELGIKLYSTDIDRLYTCKNHTQLDNMARDMINRQWKPCKTVTHSTGRVFA